MKLPSEATLPRPPHVGHRLKGHLNGVPGDGPKIHRSELRRGGVLTAEHRPELAVVSCLGGPQFALDNMSHPENPHILRPKHRKNTTCSNYISAGNIENKSRACSTCPSYWELKNEHRDTQSFSSNFIPRNKYRFSCVAEGTGTFSANISPPVHRADARQGGSDGGRVDAGGLLAADASDHVPKCHPNHRSPQLQWNSCRHIRRILEVDRHLFVEACSTSILSGT